MADLIDRGELRKDFCNMCEAMEPKMIDCEKKGCMSMQIIDEQPSVNRWIPCSERLPEDNAEVLVSFGRRYVKIGYIEPCDGPRYWVIPGHSVVPLDYIEAWMPMPDAYEPRKAQKNA